MASALCTADPAISFLFPLERRTHSAIPVRRPPARMLLITAPPGHEKYFDELRDLIAKGKPDPEALAKLRAKYDTVQLATLTAG